jgi:alginate O-acetyltransferase complex protein AlgJ
MLRRYRRLWGLVAIMLLATPMLVNVMRSETTTISSDEARVLSPLPSLPRQLMEWTRLPNAIDAYWRDHFGLRGTLIRANARLRFVLMGTSSNESVLVGSDGWMFYRGNNMLQQSAGLLVRPQGIAEQVDMLVSMRKALAERGAKLIIAIPPNSSTIYGDKLPPWARNSGSLTEYDLLLDALAAHGVSTVDLRPILRLARAQGATYRKTDTHWTAYGALAAFNAVAGAAGHPEWHLDPVRVLGTPVSMAGGDLARMLGVAGDIEEADRPLVWPHADDGRSASEHPDHVVRPTRSAVTTIAVVGDSFTNSFFTQMIEATAGHAAWFAHLGCSFDWQGLLALQPNEVWYMPIERFMVCKHNARPLGMSAGVSEGSSSR